MEDQYGSDFMTIVDEDGTEYELEILTTMEYGNAPQNRERIYIVGFLDEEACKRFEFPTPIPRTKQLTDIMDFAHDTVHKYSKTRCSAAYGREVSVSDVKESILLAKEHLHALAKV